MRPFHEAQLTRSTEVVLFPDQRQKRNSSEFEHNTPAFKSVAAAAGDHFLRKSEEPKHLQCFLVRDRHLAVWTKLVQNWTAFLQAPTVPSPYF